MPFQGVGPASSANQSAALNSPAESSAPKIPKDLEKALTQLIAQLTQLLDKLDKGGAKDGGGGAKDAGGGAKDAGGAKGGAGMPQGGAGGAGSSTPSGKDKDGSAGVDSAGSGKSVNDKPGVSSSEDKTGMVAEINRIRAERGLNPVTYDPKIAAGAERNDAESARTGQLGHHFELDGYQAEATGFDPNGTAKSFVEGWANSSTHSGAVLNPGTERVGGSIKDGYATLGTSPVG